MRPARWLLLAAATALMPGCEEPLEPVEEPPRELAPPVEDPPVVDTDVAIDCDLIVQPDQSWAIAYREVRFTVEGGSGAPRFRFGTNASGALLDVRSGAYLAGGTTDVTDTIVVTDPACDGAQVEVTVQVVPGLVLQPARVTLRPGTAMTPRITGGSGSITCSLQGPDTGSVVEGCAYLAGMTPGTETFLVEDTLTGERVSATVRIDAAAALTSDTTRWGAPVGVPLQPTLFGGSGIHDFEVVDGDIDITEDGLVATAPGQATVRVTDRYAGLDLALTFDGLDTLVPDHLQAHGHRIDGARLLGGHDLDGDGYEDLVLVNSEISIDRWMTGAALIFAGSRDGIPDAPTQTLAGGRDARMGHGATLVDIDGDGELDLAIGAYQDSSVGTAQGALYVFRGVPGAFFEEEPFEVLSTGARYDRMGLGVAACDLDADGYQDVLISAYEGEDPDAEAAATSQGVVHGYRGGPMGLDDTPAWTLVGRVPDSRGDWIPREYLRFGRDIATGDLNADGRCDLVVGAYQAASSDSGAGSAYVYLGDEGGLSEHADVVVDHDPRWADSDGRLGRRVAMADLDGLPGDELILAGDGVNRDGTNRGVVAVFDEATLLTGELVIDLEEATWTIAGERTYDLLGRGLGIADLDDDGVMDILTGSYHSEPSGGPYNVGSVSVWWGGDIRADLRRGYEPSGPSAVLYGTESNSAFGLEITATDADGDGTSELYSLTGRDSEDVPWGGAIMVWEDLDDPPRRIGLQRSQTVSLIGYGLSWAQDDAGDPTLAIGAPNALSQEPRLRGGQAWTVRLDDPKDREVFGQLDLHRDYERAGWSVSGGSDFDGDGLEEVFVLHRDAYRPATWDTERFDNPEGCAPNLSRTGAVQVFTPGDPVARAVFYGFAGDGLEVVLGGSDLNGDGYDDLVVSSIQDAGRQGVWIVPGRALASDRTTVLCEGTFLQAAERSSQLGTVMAGLGDIDGDGCDDIAVGGYSDDRGRSNQGAVRILHGFGGAGCPTSPSVTDIVPNSGSAYFGRGLAAGDLTGDGRVDLAISATNQAGLDGARGVVYLLDGRDLARLPTVPVSGERLPSGPIWSLLDQLTPLAILRADPVHPFLGQSLAIGGAPGERRLWVPSLASELGGGQGNVRAFRWTGDALQADRIWIGPTASVATQFGTRLLAHPQSNAVAISAYYATGIGVENGEVYLWTGHD